MRLDLFFVKSLHWLKIVFLQYFFIASVKMSNVREKGLSYAIHEL